MTPTRRRAESTALQRSVDVACWVLALLGVAALAARHWRSDDIRALAIVAFTPYLMIAPGIALVVALLTRRRLTAVAAAVVSVACLSTRVPHHLADDPPPDAVKIVVMTANLHGITSDPVAVVDAVRRNHVDVLMLQELAWDQATKLREAGLLREVPFLGGRPGIAAEGTGLFSRFPITPASVKAPLMFVTVKSRMTVPHVKDPVNIVALHVTGPSDASAMWRRDIRQIPAYFAGLPAGPTIVGGDFNATPDNPWFRDILKKTGFADAADQAGAGLINTYSALMPVPLIAIDHILTRGVVATRVEPVAIPGSDHRGILATIEIPRDY